MEPEEEYDYIRDTVVDAVVRSSTKLSTAGYDTSSSLTLANFVVQCTGTLPVTMTACISYNGGKISLCQGQQYSVLAIKEQKYVSVQDMDHNTYTVPLDSPILFGPIHSTPAVPLNQSVLGIKYSTAEDIMKQHMTPSVVCSLGTYKSRYPDGCIDENEILVLKELKSKGVLRKGPAFQAYSITNSCSKSIGRHCDCGFTTLPEKVKMTLANISAHVPEPFPSMAVTFVQQGQTGLPRQLASKVVTLEKVVTKEVMVVKEIGGAGEPFDLPVDTPVRVTKSDSVLKRSEVSGTGSSDKSALAGSSHSRTSSIKRAGSTGSNASAGCAVRSSGSGRSVDRINSAPPPLPPDEDIYDNEGMAQSCVIQCSVTAGEDKSNSVSALSLEKPCLPPRDHKTVVMDVGSSSSSNYVGVKLDAVAQEAYDYAWSEDLVPKHAKDQVEDKSNSVSALSLEKPCFPPRGHKTMVMDVGSSSSSNYVGVKLDAVAQEAYDYAWSEDLVPKHAKDRVGDTSTTIDAMENGMKDLKEAIENVHLIVDSIKKIAQVPPAVPNNRSAVTRQLSKAN